MESQRRWIGRSEAMERLGVKSQILYAYVSRGRITARPDPANPRRSLYAADDVARLRGDAPAGALRPASPFIGSVSRGEAAIDSRLTVIADGRLFYRGRDAVQLARQATVEETARTLWGVDADPFRELKPRVDTVVGGSHRARVYAALARRVDEDGAAGERDREALAREAAAVMSEVFDALAGPGPRLHLHQRLARAYKVGEREAQMLRRALVLGADHDMSASALAARVAASGGSSPAGCALAGLVALVGSAVVRRLEAANDMVTLGRRNPEAALHSRLVNGEIPGFGNSAYPGGDPRAAALLDAIELSGDLKAFVDIGRQLTGQEPSFELALALLARRLDLPRGGAMDLLILARLVGLMAHGLDQAFDGSPIRARLRYVGLEPGAH
jgi:citrate synthase